MRIAVAIMMTNKERRKRLVRQAQIIKKILLRKKNATKKIISLKSCSKTCPCPNSPKKPL